MRGICGQTRLQKTNTFSLVNKNVNRKHGHFHFMMTSHCTREGECVPYMTLKNAITHLGHIMKDALRCGSSVSQPAHMLRSLAELTNTL